MSPRVLKHLNSKNFSAVSSIFLGFSLKFKLFSPFSYRFPAVIVYFFFLLPFFSLRTEEIKEPQNLHWNSEQILFITASSKDNFGYLDFYTMRQGEWVAILEKIPVRLGRNGLISGNDKREGDGFSPTGIFPLKRIVGKQKKEIRNLEYTQIRKNHHWSDSPSSKNYNQLISRSEKGAVPLWESYIYDLFIVIEHNTKPANPGFGSMIFIHPWTEDKPTSGCVGVSKGVLETILPLLDGDKKPYIILDFVN